MVRRMDWQGDVLIWCRKCSGYARQKMGPQLMNRCKSKKVCTEEHGKMLKTKFRFLEDCRIPATEARNWKIQGHKRRITREEYR